MKCISSVLILINPNSLLLIMRMHLFIILKLFYKNNVFVTEQALDLIRGKNVLLLMDSSLEGQYANEDATALVELASKCLQYEARDRPDVKFLVTSVAPLEKQKEVKV